MHLPHTQSDHLTAATPTGMSRVCVCVCALLQGFFRRSIQQNIQYKKCVKNESCSVVRINRNRCQQCRFRKCLSVGMSRDGETPEHCLSARPSVAGHRHQQMRCRRRTSVSELFQHFLLRLLFLLLQRCVLGGSRSVRSRGCWRKCRAP